MIGTRSVNPAYPPSQTDMPVYVYETLNDAGASTGERFEVVQPMSEAALTEHPQTGQPVRRVYLPPNLGLKHSPGKTASKLDNKNVEKAGFTKYERDKLTGKYNRVAGNNGPAALDPRNFK